MRHVIGIGEMKQSARLDDTLVTFALGSCLGVTVYDPDIHLGIMVHLMLPTSKNHLDKADLQPCLYVDTGLIELFQSAYKAGADPKKLEVTVAGGASLRGAENDVFEIGKRNLAILRQLLIKNAVKIQAEDVGGHMSRTMTLQISTGRVQITSLGKTRELGTSPQGSLMSLRTVGG